MRLSHIFHCHYNIRSEKYNFILSVATVTDICIYWGNVLYLQKNLENQRTEHPGATDSAVTDIPVAEKEESTEGEVLH
jgi:hypothetical protein